MRHIIKSIVPNSLLEKYRAFKKAQRNKRFAENSVECPICDSRFKIFGDYGIRKRTNAKCYNCGSLERHRLIYLYLSNKEGLNLFDKNTKPIKLLHFAPEQIFYKKFDHSKQIAYQPCDLFPELYDYGGESTVEKVDITNIKFQDESFDFIMCNHVLEHIPDDKLAMSELYRVLAKGGSGIFQVPIDYSRKETYEDWSISSPEEREKAFGQHDHVRWYGQDYKDRLAAVGFHVNEIELQTIFTPKEIFKYGLMKSEKLYHCHK